MTLKDQPIQQKLRTLILLTSSTALFLTCAGFVAYEWITFRQEMVQNFSMLAEITALNSTAVLAFENEKEAKEVLGALRVEKHIIGAALYDKNDKLFATYPTNSASTFATAPEKWGHRFTRSHLILFCPVLEGDKRLGTLCLKSDLSAIYEKFRLYAAIVVLVILVSWLVAFAVSAVLQRRISRPILALAETAKAVSDRKDYSVRARKVGEDELGLLTDAFNQMLNQIQQQDLALRESEARKGAMFDSALDGIISIDSQGRIIEFNPAAEQIFGYNRAQALGQNMAELIVPASLREAHRQGLAKYLATGKGPVLGRRIEMTAQRADGTEFPVELSITRIGLGGSPTFNGFLRDIAERRRFNQDLEQRVLKRTTELEAANKELEAFSYSVSHDLRAPLRGIVGFAQLLVKSHQDRLDKEGKRWLGIIQSETQRMGRLIDELLNFSRLGRQQMQSSLLDMGALAQSVFQELTALQTDRTPQFELKPLPPARGDQALLRQVFVNLLSNAVKFTRHREGARIELGSRNEGEENIYYVQDNGVGFDPKYVHKLFGVFQRLHHEDEFEGTGVGLALVQRIVHRHGGRIWAEAVLNKGATFYFALPREKENAKT
jgi:PAS domain S-box-containing protein